MCECCGVPVESTKTFICPECFKYLAIHSPRMILCAKHKKALDPQEVTPA